MPSQDGYIYILTDSYGSSYAEDKDYGAWEEHYSTEIRGWTDKDTWSSHSVSIDFPLDKSETYFLVHATYSSGNSFGNSSGNKSYVHVFKDKDLAYKCKFALEEGYKKYQSKEIRDYREFEKFDIHYMTDSGIKIPVCYYEAWCGYFETLDSIDVEEIMFIEKEDI